MIAVRRERLSPEDLKLNLEALDELNFEVDDRIASLPLTAGVDLAQRFQLTAYDAAYLELAVRRTLPIMTRDEKLARAATVLGLLWAPP